MSQPFDPNQNPPPYVAQYAYPPAKPTSVMVIGVIGIILGALGAICTPISLLGLLVKPTAGSMQYNPTIAAMESSTVLKAWMFASVVIGTLTAIWLLVGSIGSVALKRWARGMMLTYAWVQIPLVLIGLVMNIVFLTPAIMSQMNAGGANNPGATAGAVGGIIGGLIGSLIGLALPICILIFFRKPNVVAAFNGTTVYR